MCLLQVRRFTFFLVGVLSSEFRITLGSFARFSRKSSSECRRIPNMTVPEFNSFRYIVGEPWLVRLFRPIAMIRATRSRITTLEVRSDLPRAIEPRVRKTRIRGLHLNSFAHSTTATSSEVISHYHEYDICVFSRSVGSPPPLFGVLFSEF